MLEYFENLMHWKKSEVRLGFSATKIIKKKFILFQGFDFFQIESVPAFKTSKNHIY